MEYSTTQKQSKQWIAFKGAINEDSEVQFKELHEKIGNSKECIFNFSEVTNINSLGVRAWVNFLRSLEGGKKIRFKECPPEIIMQINMIPSFLGNAEVESFYVNYLCEICYKKEKKLVKTARLEQNSIPRSPCCQAKNCGMQTEELEDEYFAFLRRPKQNR